MIVAGVGFRRGVGAPEIVALVERALAEASLERPRIVRLATAAALADNPAFVEAARRLGAEPAAIDDSTLRACEGPTRSQRALAAHGVGSVAEAAALGGAGPGAALVLPRIASAAATCALARSAGP